MAATTMPTMERTEGPEERLARAISFPAGNDDFRAARNACARAYRRFNETHEDAAPEIRCERWLDIISPNRPRSQPPANTTTLDMTFRNPTLVPAAPFVKPPVHVDYGLRVRVGASTFVNRYCMIMDTPVADVVVGERCNVGPHCAILAVGHPVGLGRRTGGNRPSTGRAGRVGDGVWIGARVTIMGGVTIGDGAVIGACSLVTRSIPPRALAYGAPAEVARILDEDVTAVDRQQQDEEEEEEVCAETLEEALKLRSSEATPATSPTSANGMEGGGGEKDKAKRSAAASGGVCERSRQQHLGIRDSYGLTRAEILALVALAVSFMGCFFFVALLVLTKWESDASLPRVRDL